MKATVQKICKYAKDENEVREILEAIWKKPEKDARFLPRSFLEIKSFISLRECLKTFKGYALH